MNGDTSKVDAQLARASNFAQTVPVAAWLFVPLVLTIIAATLARFGLLQKCFGDLYKQLTDSHNQTGKRLKDRDEQRLHHMLQGWKGPMPYLERTDSWIALWSGSERWSLAGFDRCWLIALVYPMAVLMLVWAATNNGNLGSATVLTPVDDAWRRWATVLAITVAYMIGYRFVPSSHWFRQLSTRIVPIDRQNVFWAHLAATIFDRPYFGIFVAMVLAVVVGAIPALIVSGPLALVSLANAGASTSVIVLALCIAGLRVLAGGDIGVVAVAIAVAFAFAGALGTFGVGAAVGIFIILVVMYSHQIRSLLVTHTAKRSVAVYVVVTAYSMLYALSILLIPHLPRWGFPLASDALNGNGTPFVMLTFLGAIPLLNGVADWVSLNATRAFISRMQTGATRGIVARLYMWDIAVALLLTIFVYGATLGILLLMQRGGWQVDVKSILAELRDNAWSGQSTWLLALAVTNFIPTLVHMVLWLSDRLQSRDTETREDIEQFLKSGGKDAAQQIAPTIIYVLRIQKWLERAMVLSLTLALIPFFAICVPWAAGQMLRFV